MGTLCLALRSSLSGNDAKGGHPNVSQHQGCELPRTERFAEDQQRSEVTRFAQLDEIPALLGLMIVAYIVSALCSLT